MRTLAGRQQREHNDALRNPKTEPAPAVTESPVLSPRRNPERMDTIAQIQTLVPEIEETVEEANASAEKIYVAVGKDMSESASVIRWALQNLTNIRWASVILLHIRLPIRYVDSPMGRFPVNKTNMAMVNDQKRTETEEINSCMKKYLEICSIAKVKAEYCIVEKAEVSKGIVEAVAEFRIEKLIMGTTSSRKPGKANYVRKHVIDFCEVSIVCKGKLAVPSEGSPISPNHTDNAVQKSKSYRRSLADWLRRRPETSPVKSSPSDFSRSDSSPACCQASSVSPVNEVSTPSWQEEINACVIEPAALELTMAEGNCFESEEADNPDVDEVYSDVNMDSEACGNSSSISTSEGFEEATMDYESLKLQLREALKEANKAKIKAQIEIKKRKKAEVEAVKAIQRVKDRETHALKEAAKENEDARSLVRRTKQQCEEITRQRDEAVEQAQILLEVSRTLETRVNDASRQRDETILELQATYQRKLAALEEDKHRILQERNDAIRQLQDYLSLRPRIQQCEEITRQRDEAVQQVHILIEVCRTLETKVDEASRQREETIQELQAAYQRKLAALEEDKHRILQERNDAIKQLQDYLALRPRIESATSSSSSVHLQFREYCFDDIIAATCNFADHFKLGQGGYGMIYKGEIDGTTVAVKILSEDSLQGRQEFQREIDILKDIRHPHLVRIVGACSEQNCIVYEYMSNGCLEDRLCCKNGTPPLPWRARIRIAAEVCSALQFLHSLEPDPIVHRDLKPQNILLDENYVSKISDFGLARPLPQDLHRESEPKGTFPYMDPEYLSTGEFTIKSDIYSLGMVILQLLTGKPALRLANEVEIALDSGKLNEILDPSAGKWPFVQAFQLAYLALHCTETNRKNRPDLQPAVMKMLGNLRVSANAESSSGVTSIGRDQRSVQDAEETEFPNFFLCPIFQEIMHNPHVAADGFTYELEAIKGWLESGHGTSPMTNLKFAHKNLIPNHSLRSAIRQWQQKFDFV